MRRESLKLLATSLSFAMAFTGCGITDSIGLLKPQGNVSAPSAEVTEDTAEASAVVQYNNAYEKQREELIAMHLENPSEAYLEAISQIPVEINDP